MDSGNSGSMQSSSGGDDQEFDSRGGESISSFINAPHHFGSISAPPPPFLSHQNPNFFDPHLSQNLDHGGHYTNDNDLIWSRGLRSDHAFSSLGNNSLPFKPQPISLPGTSSADSSAWRASHHRRRSSSHLMQEGTRRSGPGHRGGRRPPCSLLTPPTSGKWCRISPASLPTFLRLPLLAVALSVLRRFRALNPQFPTLTPDAQFPPPSSVVLPLPRVTPLRPPQQQTTTTELPPTAAPLISTTISIIRFLLSFDAPI